MSRGYLYKAEAINIESQSSIFYKCDNTDYDYHNRMYPPNLDKLVIGSENYLLGSGKDTDDHWRENEYNSTNISKRKNPFIINGNVVEEGSNSYDSNYYITYNSKTGIYTLKYPNMYYNIYEEHNGNDKYYCYVYTKKSCMAGTKKNIRFDTFLYLALSEPCSGYPDIIQIKEIGIMLENNNKYRVYYLEGNDEVLHLSREEPIPQSFNQSRWEQYGIYALRLLRPLSYYELMYEVDTLLSENVQAMEYLHQHCTYGGCYLGGNEFVSQLYCDNDLLVAKFSRPNANGQYTDYTHYYDDFYRGDHTMPLMSLSPVIFSEFDAPSWTDSEGSPHHPVYLLYLPFTSEDEFNAAKAANYYWSNSTEQILYLENMNMPKAYFDY